MTDCANFKPSNVCMEVVHGVDMSFDVVLTDGNLDPINITNDKVEFTVRDKPQGTIKIQKSNAAGSHIDPTNGKTSFTIAGTDYTETATQDAFFWVYEVRRVTAASKEIVHIEGAFNVFPAVGGQP